MSRWHDDDCAVPDIFWTSGGALVGVPQCRSCNASAQSAIYAAIEDPLDSFPPCPPDEPPGQLNLHWPATVKYTSSEPAKEEGRGIKTRPNSTYVESGPDTIKSSSLDALTSEQPATLTGGPPDRALPFASASLPVEPVAPAPVESPVYPERLSADQLRLVCLNAAKTTLGAPFLEPIHLDLEVFAQGNCEEYDATSYTWATEDGDASRRFPVFVGRNWDVLMQTRNCWDMLLYLRPRKGVRMLWVDAISIHQQDVSEKAVQVPQMGRIFKGATRVWLWLGSDMVVLPSAGRRK
jgi:hypothetical protein